MRKISENGMKLWMVGFIALFCSAMQAQVTIGAISNPHESALLDLKEQDPTNLSNPNSEKGVLFPKVSLTDAKSLQPLIKGVATAADSVKVRGMIVYNVNENANGIDLGLSVWNGEEWMSVVGGGANKAAVFTIDWANVKVNGTYVKGKALTPSNTLSVPVTVSKKGIYSITATASANGYAFSASGQFMATGSYTLTLNSMGTPAQSNASGDVLAFMNNNLDITDTDLKVKVTVDDVEPEYTCNCGTINKGGVSLKTGQAASGDLILEISAPLDAIGAEYSITTNKIDGVQFSGSGKLQGGNQRVYLTASGTPTKFGQQTFTITTNSTATSATTCSVNLPIIGRIIKVKAYSTGYDDRELGYSTSNVRILLNNTNLFGPTSTYCPVQGISVSYTAGDDVFPSSLSTSDCDIVIFSWNSIPNSQTRRKMITDFLDNKGVVILCSETGIPEILKTVTKSSGNFTSSDAANSGTRYPFSTNNNSPIVNGKYMNLSGKHIGIDGSANYNFTIPSDVRDNIEIIASPGGSTTNAFMLRTLNRSLIVCGDGGPFVGRNENKSSKNDYPMLTDSSLPAVKNMSGGDVYNAHLFVNIMMWAINERLRVQP